MSHKRFLNIFFWLWLIIATFFLAKNCSRIFIGDWFPVNTTSMIPTIVPGDKIWVNKLIFGARVYKNLDFLDGKPLKTFRVKGWRKIRRGDVVVFNAPIQRSGVDSIVFKIDYVFVKRCIGLPGDTVWIHKPVGQFNTLDSLSNVLGNSYYGMIHVPQKGDTICMNDSNIRLYLTVITYETVDSLPTDLHIFRSNYYFMCGDNTLHSFDSRYFGFVPEEFIIGVSRRVLFNNRDGLKQKVRGRRIFKRLT